LYIFEGYTEVVVIAPRICEADDISTSYVTQDEVHLVWDPSDVAETPLGFPVPISNADNPIKFNIEQPVEHPSNGAKASELCKVTCTLDSANAIIVSEFGASGDIVAELDDMTKTMVITSYNDEVSITGLVYYTCVSDDSLVPGGTYRNFITVESFGRNVCWDDELKEDPGNPSTMTIVIDPLENQP